MLELSIKVSLNPLIEVRMQCIKLLSKHCIKQHLETLVYVCSEAHFFTNFAYVILMHWCVISILCKMTRKLLASITEKSLDNMRVWCMRLPS